jgi:CheY-like chemotaxis protein
MNNSPTVLVVDSNEPFATMLRESLEQNGNYRTSMALSSDEALEAISDQRFDLAIVDLGLDDAEDPGGDAVVRELRQQQPDLRLIVIPLDGERIPTHLKDLPVQGVLPKPFFLPDLPACIDNALTQPIPEAKDSPAPSEVEAGESEGPSEAVEAKEKEVDGDLWSGSVPEMYQTLETLTQEINAEAVLLTRGQELLASAGPLASDEVDDLKQVVADSWSISNQVAQALGRNRVCFEQSVDGGEYMFYSLAVDENVILSAALSDHIPLGMIRHQAKQIASDLSNLIDETH